MGELFRKIRKKYQKEIGLIQDLVVEKIYNFFPNAVAWWNFNMEMFWE